MTLLDDAKRLGDARITREGTVWCHFCGGMIEEPLSYDPPLAYSEQHSPDCPWLQMPAIVKALEAAERMVAGLGRGVDGGFVAAYPDEECWRCIVCHEETLWVDGAVPQDFRHDADCAGQALVSAIRGAERQA